MSIVRRPVGPKRVVLTLAAVYAVALGLLVFGPWGWGLNRVTVRLYFLFRDDWPVAPPWLVPDDYGVILNVMLFVPLGAFLAILTGRAWSATALAVVFSAVVELVQWRWLDREASWSDVLANTLGSFLGALAVTLLARARRRPASRPEKSRHP